MYVLSAQVGMFYFFLRKKIWLHKCAWLIFGKKPRKVIYFQVTGVLGVYEVIDIAKNLRGCQFVITDLGICLFGRIFFGSNDFEPEPDITNVYYTWSYAVCTAISLKHEWQIILLYINIYHYIPESPKCLKFEPLNHQKQTFLGPKFEMLGGSRYIFVADFCVARFRMPPRCQLTFVLTMAPTRHPMLRFNTQTPVIP